MSVFTFAKNTHPVFQTLVPGDQISLNMNAIVRKDDGAYVKFEVSKFEVDRVKKKRNPAQVMRDYHVEHAG